MTHTLPKLPYTMDALTPIISQETMEYHYGKHHQAYVNNLNKLIPGTEFESAQLEDIVKGATGSIYNNAAQVWNHSFYWNCLTPTGNGKPNGRLAQALETGFGSLETFIKKFSETAITTFGSGWAWLVQNPDGSLAVESTSNAGNPLTTGKKPLLTMDVWEHAYYIDYRNARAKYVESLWEIVDWGFVKSNFSD